MTVITITDKIQKNPQRWQIKLLLECRRYNYGNNQPKRQIRQTRVNKRIDFTKPRNMHHQWQKNWTEKSMSRADRLMENANNQKVSNTPEN